MTTFTPYRDQEQPIDGAGQEVVQADQNTANDKSINKRDTLAITGDATLTAAQFHEVGFLVLTGTPGAPFDLNFPAVTANGGTAAHMRKMIKNSTDDVATIQVTGGGGARVTLPVGEVVEVQTDGTDVEELFTAVLLGGTAALATGAVSGFSGMPTMAGDASGIPTKESAGFAAFVYDTTNQELKIYDPVANQWRTIATALQ